MIRRSIYLAARTKMRRAAGHSQPLDRRAASPARLSGAAVDTKLVLVSPFTPRPAHVIPDCRSIPVNGSDQHLHERALEAVRFRWPQFSPAPSGMEASLEQGFVRIDVPDTCKHPLVEEHGFEKPRRTRQPLPPVFCVEVKRLRPESHRLEKTLDSCAIGNHRCAAEAAHVTESQLRAARFQIEHQVRMARHWFIAPQDAQLTRHTEMDDQMTASIEGEHDPFPTPAHFSDAPANERLAPAPSPAPPKWSRPDPDRKASSTNERRPQISDDRFNFRKLGHGIPQEVGVALGLYGMLPSRTTPIPLSLTLRVARLRLNFPAI
jgi:hypothetical protein